MMPRIFRTSVFLFLFLSILACNNIENSQADRPNILLILTDDQGWGDFSFHGNDSIETPNLDAFARNAVRFTNFHVSPVCAPTRASILTGKYHLRTGTTWVTHRKEVMGSEEVTIAEVLKHQGYQTALIGKWHNGEQYPNDPAGQGFDYFFGFKAGHWNNYFNTTLEENGHVVETSGYISDVLTEKAINFIDQQENTPFFCFLSYNAPHSPFQVPDKYFNKYKEKGLSDKNACIYGMIENLDDNFKLLKDHLVEKGLLDNTILIFLTDNGPNGNRFNGGLRGRKAQVYEGGTRVPLWISWPKGLATNVETDQLSGHIDLLPTVANLLNIPLPDSLDLDGINLTPILKGSTENLDRNFFTIFNEGEDKLYPGAINNGQYKLILNRSNEMELYNLESDFGEQHNLVDSLPELSLDMFRDYQAWYQRIKPNNYSIPPIPVTEQFEQEVYLPAQEGIPFGNVKFAGERGWANDYLINWINTGSNISWEVDVQSSQAYQVYISYSSEEAIPQGALSLTINGESLELGSLEPHPEQLIPSPDRVPRGEVYEYQWKKERIIETSLAAGRYSIKLMNHAPLESLKVKSISLLK